jgi:transposase
MPRLRYEIWPIRCFVFVRRLHQTYLKTQALTVNSWDIVRRTLHKMRTAMLYANARHWRCSKMQPLRRPLICKTKLAKMMETMTYKQIGEKLGVTANVIVYLKQKYGLERQKMLTEPEIERYIGQGYTQRDIADKCNVSLSSIQRWEKEYSIKHPKSHPRQYTRLEYGWWL